MSDDMLNGDKPIGAAADDRLGFSQSAQHIASSVQSMASAGGFTVGLEGDWGTGKSSFANLIIDSLNKQNDPPEIIQFSPWLVSSRAALLVELFGSIAKAALKIPLVADARDNKSIASVKGSMPRYGNSDRLKKALNAFGAHAGKLAYVADVAELAAIPWASYAGRLLRSGGKAASGVATSRTLDEEKSVLIGELNKLTRKIVIFIDDIDRLEPSEAIEIVRLVRAVIDFPNVIFVLCYSRDILAQSLNTALGIADGDKYIDKIVQVSFSVPKPEDFDLRRIFREDLAKIFPTLFESQTDERSRAMLRRLSDVIDQEGGRSLTTPRDVARALNALCLHALPVMDKIDLADMVWLQLVRLRSLKLYRWIETYLNNIAAIANGAHIPNHDAIRTLNELKEILKKDGFDLNIEFGRLSAILPGIRGDSQIDRYVDGRQDERFRIFHGLDKSSLSQFISFSRLGSPQHFRYYFALTKPRLALEDSDFSKFIVDAEENPEQAIRYFVSLAGLSRDQGGVWADLILDRLMKTGLDQVDKKALPAIVLSLAYSMDKAAKQAGTGDWGEYWIWERAKAVLRDTLKRLTEIERQPLLARMFIDGDALGWLTSILRDETFAHGIAGNNPKDESERLLSREEFNNAAQIMRHRFKTTPFDKLIETPRFTDVLFSWLQLGPEEAVEVVAWVEANTAHEEDFLKFLEHMRSWSNRNGIIVYPLKAENLKHFCDVPKVDARLAVIAGDDTNHHAAQARDLIQARTLANEN